MTRIHEVYFLVTFDDQSVVKTSRPIHCHIFVILIQLHNYTSAHSQINKGFLSCFHLFQVVMESGDQSMKQFLVPHGDDAGAETAVLDTGEAMLVDHA